MKWLPDMSTPPPPPPPLTCSEPGRVFLTTTFFIILFTVLFNGGLSAHMLAKLRLKGGPSGGVFTLRRYHSLMENGAGRRNTAVASWPQTMPSAHSAS